MRNHRWSYWLEAVTAALSCGLGLVTVAWPNWIELVVGRDPDHGNGSFEWWVVTGLFALACVTATPVARRTWRARAAAG